jgi:hypothetical protein
MTELSARGLPFPIFFAYHHLLNSGFEARHVAAVESYDFDRLFVPLSQRDAALAALEEMVEDFRLQAEADAQRAGALSLAGGDGGELSLVDDADEA